MFHDDPLGLPAAPVPPVPPAELRLWRLSDLVGGTVLLGLGIGLTVVFGIVVLLRGGGGESDPETALLFSSATLLMELWAGAVVLGLARARGISLRALGFRAPTNWSLIPLAVLLAYSSLVLYQVAVLLAEFVTGWDLSGFREGNEIPTDLPRTALIWTVLGLAVMVAAPLGEELFFRGLIYRGVAGLAGPTVGAMVSALAFSAVHANVSVVVPFAAIGMIFAWVYRASGSLWTTIAAHAIFNGVSFVLTLYGGGR